MIRPIAVPITAMALSACSTPSKLTCSMGVDVALDLEKQKFREALRSDVQRQTVFMAQEFSLKSLVPVARDNEIPFVQCHARLMGLGAKRVDTTDSEGRTTRSWELDVEEGVKELSSFRYSVRMVEDADAVWVNLE